MGSSILVTDFDAANIEAVSNSERQRASFVCFAILIGCSLVNFALSFCIREDLRRVNYKGPDETTDSYVRADVAS